jgi:DNA processing protein
MSAAPAGERQARAVLTYVTDPGDPLIGAAARVQGALATLDAIRSGTLTGPGCEQGMPERRSVIGSLRERLEQAPARGEIERWQEAGIRLVCPGDHEWPTGLDGLGGAAPVALWVAGNADVRFSCLRSVAVTGSRACTAYGSYVAAEFSSYLAGEGWTVISGGAFGIDAAAHRGALGAGGVTIAVAGGGVNVPYPAAHTELLAAVTAEGAVVSEHPPGSNVSRPRFQARSRVIAALATGTVIVEAGSRSGALAVARHAHDLGRPVMAVPGPVTSGLSDGCHQLIRSGLSTLVTRASDAAELLTAAARIRA